jgi:AcrR family transcriptional regulator
MDPSLSSRAVPAVSKRPYRRAAATKAHVLDVAARLFYRHGIRAIGIDRLAADAQVTTTTLYRIFGSKEGLVAEYLRRADETWTEWLERSTSAGGLAHFFDELDEQACAADYRGCPFRLALAEYPWAKSEVHRIAIESKRRTRQSFRDLAAAEDSGDPETAADQLMLVMDGICASAAERGPAARNDAGAALARSIIGARRRPRRPSAR